MTFRLTDSESDMSASYNDFLSIFSFTTPQDTKVVSRTEVQAVKLFTLKPALKKKVLMSY